MIKDSMRQKGSIIVALLFILMLVFLGIYFMYQIELEESMTPTRDVEIQDIPLEQSEYLVQ